MLKRLACVLLHGDDPEDQASLGFLMLLAGVLALFAARRRVLCWLPYGIEGDGPGYLKYAHDIWERGRMGAAPGHGSAGYPFMLGLVDLALGNPVRSGIALSYLSAAALLVVVYRLARSLHGRACASLAAALTASTGAFVTNAISVNSDMLHAAFFVGCVAILSSDSAHDRRRASWAGILAALAWFTRPTGIVLLPLTVLWALLSRERRRALPFAVLGFGALAAPILVGNSRVFGTPFPGINHLNVAASAYFDGDFNEFFKGGHSEAFVSWWQVVCYDPGRLLRFLATNPLRMLRALLSAEYLPTGPLLVFSLWLEIRRGPPNARWPLLAALLHAMAILPMSVSGRHLLPILPLFAPASAHLCLASWRHLSAWSPVKRWDPVRVAMGVHCFLLAIVVLCGKQALGFETPTFRDAGRVLDRIASREPGTSFVSSGAYFVGYYAPTHPAIDLPPSRIGGPDAAPWEVLRAIENRMRSAGARYLVVHDELRRSHPELADLLAGGKSYDSLRLVANADESVLVYRYASEDQPKR